MAVVVRQEQEQAAELIPNGIYPATLTGIKQFENAYGARVGFEFTLRGGDLDGTVTMRSTSPNLSKYSKLAEILSGLIGRSLEDQEIMAGIDIEELVGTNCKVLVLQSKAKSGQVYSNVEQVFK